MHNKIYQNSDANELKGKLGLMITKRKKILFFSLIAFLIFIGAAFSVAAAACSSNSDCLIPGSGSYSPCCNGVCCGSVDDHCCDGKCCFDFCEMLYPASCECCEEGHCVGVYGPWGGQECVLLGDKCSIGSGKCSSSSDCPIGQACCYGGECYDYSTKKCCGGDHCNPGKLCKIAVDCCDINGDGKTIQCCEEGAPFCVPKKKQIKNPITGEWECVAKGNECAECVSDSNCGGWFSGKKCCDGWCISKNELCCENPCPCVVGADIGVKKGNTQCCPVTYFVAKPSPHVEPAPPPSCRQVDICDDDDCGSCGNSCLIPKPIPLCYNTDDMGGSVCCTLPLNCMNLADTDVPGSIRKQCVCAQCDPRKNKDEIVCKKNGGAFEYESNPDCTCEGITGGCGVNGDCGGGTSIFDRKDVRWIIDKAESFGIAYLCCSLGKGSPKKGTDGTPVCSTSPPPKPPPPGEW